MRLTTFAAGVLLLPLSASAVTALRGLRPFIQPDGTVVMLQRVGDEYGHYLVTEDNYPVIKDNGVYCYAKAGDISQPMISTGVAVGAAEERTAEVRQMLATTAPEQAIAMAGRRASARRAAAAATMTTVATTAMVSGSDMLIGGISTIGDQRGLVILAAFSDVDFTVDNPQEYFTRMLNEEGFSDYGATGSARDYYIASSMGQFRPQFDVYGPVTLANPRAYYGENDSSGDDKNAELMVAEAVKALDPDIDYSVYDTDGDGYVDNVTVIYAGVGEADSDVDDAIWPHAYYLSYANLSVRADGVKINRYNCINEWTMAWGTQLIDCPAGIGTFCHEFAHVLGLPDLYNTDNPSALYTPGEWSVLDYGPYNNEGRTPPLFSCYEAYCCGWVEPVRIDHTMECSLEPVPEQCYVVETGSANEFFMFENRKLEGWDYYLPNKGMLIWHIDYLLKSWYMNEPNNEQNHQRVDLVEADNLPTRAKNGDSWPGSMGKYDTFNATSTPAFVTFDNEATGVSIENIKYSYSTGVVTFSAVVDGSNGIEAVEAVEGGGEVVYFDLMGRRVANPAAGQMLLRRCGSEVSKVVI